jgi:hypothetical protein
MPSEAAKYLQYARECARLARQARSEEHREKLVRLARVWMDAATTEEELTTSKTAPVSTS